MYTYRDSARVFYLSLNIPPFVCLTCWQVRIGSMEEIHTAAFHMVTPTDNYKSLL